MLAFKRCTLAIALLSGFIGAPWPPLAAAAEVTVQLDQPVPQPRSMIGFLHGMSGSAPDDRWIAPLQPKLWRTGTMVKEVYPRAVRLGARVTVVVSDIWGYNPKREPYLMFPQFESQVRRMVQTFGDRPVIYDIWNEPTGKDFWRGTPQQFIQTFKVAHDAIRSVRPDAVIAGPSFVGYRRELLEQFLDGCLAQGVRLDVLTWHDFRAGPQLAQIEQDLKEARRLYVEGAKYRRLGIKEIHLNEVIPRIVHLDPVHNLAVFDRMERGGADSAARACWDEPSGKNNCWSNTLEGLLTFDGQPRAIWWAYRAYAQGAMSRVAATSDDPKVVVLASAKGGSAGGPQVLLGAQQLPGDRLPASYPVRVHVQGMRKDVSSVRMIALRPTGEAAVPELPAAVTVPIGSQGRLDLNLEIGVLYQLEPALQ